MLIYSLKIEPTTKKRDLLELFFFLMMMKNDDVKVLDPMVDDR